MIQTNYVTIIIRPGAKVLDPKNGGWYPVHITKRITNAEHYGANHYKFRDAATGLVFVVNRKYTENRT